MRTRQRHTIYKDSNITNYKLQTTSTENTVENENNENGRKKSEKIQNQKRIIRIDVQIEKRIEE